jgi:hypothetical protein
VAEHALLELFWEAVDRNIQKINQKKEKNDDGT